jgi:hypothetical protein
MMRLERTLTGYARAAVDARIQMCRVAASRPMRLSWQMMFDQMRPDDAPRKMNLNQRAMVDEAMEHTSTTWHEGEMYVVAPAMTAIVVAAGDALDVSTLVVHMDDAPSPIGIVFFPEPIYVRDVRGSLLNIAAMTWSFVEFVDNRIGLDIVGWSDITDPHDVDCIQIHKLIVESRDAGDTRLVDVGPYVMAHYERALIGEIRPDDEQYTNYTDEEDNREWQPTPEGLFVIDATVTGRRSTLYPLLYSFWHLQGTKIASVERPQATRSTRKRAERAKVATNCRIVMLRRTQSSSSGGDEAHWHYSVRFAVRGHWRRLRRTDGTEYRTWVHAHIKGPDGAPLLHGEKIFMLAR